jgi:hypothetical protein
MPMTAIVMPVSPKRFTSSGPETLLITIAATAPLTWQFAIIVENSLPDLQLQFISSGEAKSRW